MNQVTPGQLSSLEARAKADALEAISCKLTQQCGAGDGIIIVFVITIVILVVIIVVVIYYDYLCVLLLFKCIIIVVIIVITCNY